MARSKGTRLSNRVSMYKSVVTDPIKSEKINRNDVCPCGSGTKYKHCCGDPGLGMIERWLRDRKIKKIIKQRNAEGSKKE